MNLEAAVNIEDLRAIARRRVPRFVFSYVDGGAEDEVTLRGNCEAFARLRFRPRTLVDVSRRDVSTRLLGAPAALRRLWLQAYVFAERSITDALIRRALDAGFEGLMLTSDFPVAGKRERDW